MSSAYPFSVVIPAYNVEPFITAAIESVIAQDIGFSNIQLILVDDGSTDGTDKIIDRYAKKYPDNIIALHQKNAGVSAARNAGLALAVGKYVNCLDSDDMWESHVFSRVFSFFEEHYDETDIVSCPIYHFTESPDKNKPHYLNHKFRKGSRVILLDKEPNAILYSSASIFIKREAITLPFFEPGLAFSEDLLALQQLLLKRQTLGVVHNCPYWYRRRTGETELSAMQRKEMDKQWYCDRLERVFLKLEHESLAKFQTIPRFIQYAVCNDLFSALQQNKQFSPEAGLCPEDIEKFWRLVREILCQIEDGIILGLSPHPGLSFELRFRALQLKYGRDPVLTPLGNDFMVGFPPEAGLLKRFSEFTSFLDFLTADGDDIILEGRFIRFAGIADSKIEFFLSDRTRSFPAEVTEIYQDPNNVSLGYHLVYYHVFKVKIPVSSWNGDLKLELFCVLNGIHIPIRSLKPTQYFPIGRVYKSSYCVMNGVKITLAENRLYLTKNYSLFRSEMSFLKEIWRAKKEFYKKVVLLRILYHALTPLRKRPIWLISDRALTAGDNGEAFFRYLLKNHKNIRSYFIISKNAPAWERLKKLPHVVDIDSLKYKFLSILCNCFISAYTEPTRWQNSESLRDIMRPKRIVFLQHGVTKDDISDVLRRQKRNISGFVVSARGEYDSVVHGNYGYSPEEVWLTGFPRYDLLENAPEKLVTIMPTWRKYVTTGSIADSIHMTLKPDFQKTKFCRFYSDLLTDQRLLDAAAEYGYKLAFFPHALLMDHIGMFRCSPQIEIVKPDTLYKDIFKRSSLMITDFSSAVFDFAYLHKPVIYAQFDKDLFLAGHYPQGYFDYERDGFGEVEYDLNSTVDRIIEYMKNDCQLKDKYRERINAFFAFHDRHCCDRVFARIAEIAGKPE